MQRLSEARASVKQRGETDRGGVVLGLEPDFVELRNVAQVDENHATTLRQPTSERQRRSRRAATFFAGDQRRQRPARPRRDLRQAIGERGDRKRAAVVDARGNGLRCEIGRRRFDRRRRRGTEPGVGAAGAGAISGFEADTTTCARSTGSGACSSSRSPKPQNPKTPKPQYLNRCIVQ